MKFTSKFLYTEFFLIVVKLWQYYNLSQLIYHRGFGNVEKVQEEVFLEVR